MGGVERASSNLANEFNRQGFDVFIFCIFRHKRFFQLNEDVVLFEPKLNIPQRLNIISAPFRIRKTTIAIKPDTILVFNKFAGALTLAGLINLKYPIFISERNSPFYKFPLYVEVFSKLINRLFKPKGIIAQTEYAANHQQKYYKMKVPVKVINNAVRNVEIFNLSRQEMVIAVGRLTDKMKGFDRIVQSFSFINNEKWELVFAGGDINDGKKLYQQATELGIQSRVSFIGKIEEIDMIYAKAGIFVLPSRTEGFPNALVEAMAAGLPCIAFKYNPGISEIIEDGFNGILVEEGNIPALAEKLDYLMANDAERIRLGNNARLIRDKLSSDIISAQYLDFILPN